MVAFYAWLRRHPMLVDGLLAVGLLTVGTTTVRTASYGPLPLVLAIAIDAPVVVRRRYPVAAFAAAMLVFSIEGLTSRPETSQLAIILVLLYTLAAYRPRKFSAPGLAVCLLGCWLVALTHWAPPPPPYPHSLTRLGEVTALVAAPVLLAWLLGDLLRWRRGYYQALEERADRLERERDAQAQIAAAAERARIARELHDVVAHNVSVMVVQADGAAFALESRPEQARQALAAISRTGRQALAEMRSLIGVLRTAEGDNAGLAPQPGIEQLAELLDQTRAAGLPVSFAVEGVPRPLSDGVALTAYRIVQESLTNARKHGGPGVTAAVTLRFCDEGLAIKVTDDGKTAAGVTPGHAAGVTPGHAAGVTPASAIGSADGHGQSGADGHGHGLIGMRERVELYGGTVTAGPRAGGGYRVTVTLPLDGAARGAA